MPQTGGFRAREDGLLRTPDSVRTGPSGFEGGTGIGAGTVESVRPHAGTWGRPFGSAAQYGQRLK
jgi:hypothetical protein